MYIQHVTILVTIHVLGFQMVYMLQQVPSTLYVMHVMNFTRLPHFSVSITEKLGGGWVRG